MTTRARPALTVSETDLGTSESAWRTSVALAHVPETADVLALVAPIAPAASLAVLDEERAPRVVVVAPHPDDEVLAVGGTLASLARLGWRIEVVAVTDGEGSHPRSRTITPAQLAERRAAEREEALTRLGLARATVIRLGHADAAVARASDLSGALLARLRQDGRASLCLAPWTEDGHPDHDAAGRAAKAACRTAGVPLLEYPVWAWHWAQPDGHELPWRRARRLRLDADVLAAKRAAIAAYRSQIEPLGPDEGDEAVLPRAIVARFDRPFEVLFA